MKILYDHQAFSLQNAGGITRYFAEIMSRLCQVGGVKPFALLGFSGGRAVIKDGLGPDGRVVLWSYPRFAAGLGRYALNETIMSGVALTAGNFDIYHNTLYRFMPFARARRRVATQHDCIQERFPELFRNRERIYRAKRDMFREADLIFCVSQSSQSDLEEFYGIGPQRTKVVYNGIAKMDRTLKGRNELSKIVDREFVLYVGRRDAYKNFAGLLKAIQMAGTNRTHKLLALGGGLLSAEEKRLIKSLGLEEAITVVPHASPDLLAECYGAARLLVYPSLYEGFGIPPLEAMQMGCPALVAGSPATREICGDGAFFFDPYRLDEFSEMLKVSLFDASAREAMIERGRKVVTRYSWDRTAVEVLAGYREIL